jgi:hypothetical protein
VEKIPIDMHPSFSNLIFEEQTHLAEREFASFLTAVNQSYGPDQAKLSEEDWLEESELIDSPPRSEPRNWHAVTVAASARLANRVIAKPERDGSENVHN